MKLSEAPQDWRGWLSAMFPSYVQAGFSARHVEFWEWAWSIEPQMRPRPFVALWPRGGAKSTSAELACAAWGARGIRRYVLYISETQEQADKHVETLASMLESLGVERALNTYGHSRGWRRSRIVTNTGFVVDALGLDTAARGIKFEQVRPDAMVLDDIDGKEDSPKQVQKKIRILTRSIFPARGKSCAMLFVQNLIHPNSIASRLADGRADFLIDRIVSGPYPAIEGLKTEPRYDEELGRVRSVIVAGTPTWAGQDLKACQDAIDTDTLDSFLEESQHLVDEVKGALWSKALLANSRVTMAPLLKRIGIGVDPSGGGAEIGIVVAGVGFDDNGYVLADVTVSREELEQLSQTDEISETWGARVVKAYDNWKANRVFGESNFGGDMVRATIQVVDRSVPVTLVHASRGKLIRADPIAELYKGKKRRVFHVGTFDELETEMTTFTGNDKWSPNRLDAAVWVLTGLMLGTAESEPQRSTSGRSVGGRLVQNSRDVRSKKV